MMEADLQVALAHFDGQLSRYDAGDSRAVSWNSRASQTSRFAVLSEVGDLRGSEVLDVGCGVGDLYGYLRDQEAGVASYLGIDINPRMASAARRKYPVARFEHRDLLADPPEERSFDYVFESGIFNLATPNWSEIVHPTLEAMFRACRVAVAANFLSRLSGNSDPASYYADPAELIRFVAERMSRRFVLRHDYRANDFAVFVYREQ